MADTFKVMCFGDVVGRPGRALLAQTLPALRRRLNADLVVANCENAAGGLGIERGTADELRAAGVDLLTLGDHCWQRKEFTAYLEENAAVCIRPANYAEGSPGRGWTVWQGAQGIKIGVMNLIGRLFSNIPLDCPFRAADRLLAGPLADCRIVLCDMHAEATSEKLALARYLDGRISFLFGTHTHVQTADEDIFPGGTACISDLGMCGGLDGVLGMDTDAAIGRFIKGVPPAYKLASGRSIICGAFCEIDGESGKARNISRIREVA